MPVTMTLEHSLATWLPAQRWYPGGAAAVYLAIIADTPLASGDPELRHLIISVSKGSDAVWYQVLAGVRGQVPAELNHAIIGPDGHGGTAYDALHDPELTRVLLRGIAAGRVAGPLRFVAEPSAPIDETADSLVLSAEQSNTSLIFGESAILKVFRRVFPGQNPDLEVAHALAGGRSPRRACATCTPRTPAGPPTRAAISPARRTGSVRPPPACTPTWPPPSAPARWSRTR